MNRGAKALQTQLTERGAQYRLATETEIDAGYLSNVVRGLRVPGLTVRRKLKKRCNIPMDWWDEPVPAASPTGPAPQEA